MATMNGRVGDIIDEVRDQFNDTAGEYLSSEEEILRWINRCIKQLAVHGYYRKTDTLSLVADTSAYNLLSSFSDFVKLESIVIDSTNARVPFAVTRNEFDDFLLSQASGDEPLIAYQEATYLYLAPTPTASQTDYLRVYYWYAPSELNGLTPTTGSISAVADAGAGYVRMTTTSHNLSSGDTVAVTGTTDYNGSFTVGNVSSTTFCIPETYTSSQTGTWTAYKGADPELIPEPWDCLIVDFCLWHAWRRDRRNESAAQYAEDHRVAFLDKLGTMTLQPSTYKLRKYR